MILWEMRFILILVAKFNEILFGFQRNIILL